MDLLQITVALGITFAFLLRFVFIKLSTNRGVTSAEVTFSNSLWMVIGIVATLPLLYTDMANPIVASGQAAIIPFVFGAVKGCLLYLIVRMMAVLGKVSTSSSSFAGTAALPVGGLINALVFAETLTISQYIAFVVMGIFGVLYFFKGHAKEIGKKEKIAFILVTLAVCITMGVDKLVIVHSNWYFYLMWSNFVWFMISVPRLFKNFCSKVKVLGNPLVIAMGLVYVSSEFLVLYSMQGILGVSIAFMFIRLSTPIIMILAAVVWKEGNLKSQLLFGAVAFAMALLVIFKPF